MPTIALSSSVSCSKMGISMIVVVMAGVVGMTNHVIKMMVMVMAMPMMVVAMSMMDHFLRMVMNVFVMDHFGVKHMHRVEDFDVVLVF